MVRLASILVYVGLSCWKKDPQDLGFLPRSPLHVPGVFPCQQSSFSAGSPGSCSLPANLCRISSARTAGL